MPGPMKMLRAYLLPNRMDGLSHSCCGSTFLMIFEMILQPRDSNVHPPGTLVASTLSTLMHTAYYRLAIYGASSDRLVRLPLDPPLK